MRLIAIYGIPGTGKTTYLLNKIIELVMEEDYKLSDISYWTFRKPMAEDFKQRLRDAGLDGDMTYISTIHSICYRMLASEFGWTTKRNVALPWRDYVEFCKENRIPIKKEDVEVSDEEKDLKPPEEMETLGGKIYSVYCNCINTMTPFEEWTSLPTFMIPSFEPMPNLQDLVVDVIEKWIKWQEKNDKYDFAMMLKMAYDLKMKPNTAICKSDETHDMTPIQVKLAKLWSKDADEFYVAMDVRQCIYSFWGVDTSFCLEVWRRADERIVLTPSHRISEKCYNIARKILLRTGQKTPDVECIGETKVIQVNATKFLDLVKVLDKVTILARTHHHLRYVSGILAEQGIITSSWGSKMLSVYRVVWAYRNNAVVERSDFIKFVEAYPKEYFITAKERIKRIAPSELTPRDIDQYITYQFRAILKESPKPFDIALSSAFSESAKYKMNRAIQVNAKPEVKVELHTIHGSKGLEWDNVILLDGITRKIVSSITKYDSELKNECRVWYVGFTRARRLLFYIPNFFGRGLNYPFIGDLHESRNIGD